MTIKIQKILYDLIKDNISTHSVYSCKPDNLKLPYILIQNIEIEKLALEEQELFRQIKIKHNNLTDDEIIECVKKRGVIS